MRSRISYNMLDESTLEQQIKLDESSTLSRIFDFDAEQLITVTFTRFSRSSNAVAAGAGALTQSFNEVGAGRLKKAHAKLVELGGNPPPLDEAHVDKPRRKKALKLGD